MKVASLLGASVPRERSAQILRALEFKTTDADDGLDVKVPAFRRADVTREADLIEEVARIDGLEKLPATLPSRHNASGRLTDTQKLRRAASDALTAQGLHEVVGWSFVGPDLGQKLRTPDEDAVELENPMSAEQSRLRTRLIGSLLDIAGRNRARGATTLRLFEAGAVYLPNNVRRASRRALPRRCPPDRRRSQDPRGGTPHPRNADFFAAKGVLGGLLDTIRAPWTLESNGAEPFLHPGRAANDPRQPATRRLDRRDPPADRTAVGNRGDDRGIRARPRRHPLPRPTDAALRRPDELPGNPRGPRRDRQGHDDGRRGARHGTQRRPAPLLKNVEVFDVYRDPERIGDGNVSLALRLSYRAPDRTLTDEQVASVRDKISSALAQQLGGRVRAS